MLQYTKSISKISKGDARKKGMDLFAYYAEWTRKHMKINLSETGQLPVQSQQ